jgi:hypothetical protein
MIPRRAVLPAAAAMAVGLLACGERGIDVEDRYRPVAETFVQRCSGSDRPEVSGPGSEIPDCPAG